MSLIQQNKKFGLTNNQLKIIVMITMVIDHVGVALFPYEQTLRIIGRISLPIFAFMIAEGCRYTKNRTKHLLVISSMAIVFQLFYLIFMSDLYQGILITFSLSIGIIYALDSFIKNPSLKNRLLMAFAILIILFIGIACPEIFGKYGFAIDYGAWGLFLPVIIYFAPGKWFKLAAASLLIVGMSIFSSPLQWWALMAIPLLALYNGERGKHKMKYFFYIFYPLHLVIIYLIAILMAIFQ